MGRAVVGLLLCLQWVFAYQYDTLLLQAQAKIYPKLLMLKANLPVATRPVRLVVVARQEERQRAEEVVQMIARLYHGKIGGFPFETEVTTYKELERFPKAYDALYLLKGEARQIAAAVEIARWINVPTFVYDYKDLEKGAMIALVIEDAPVIYVNENALKGHTPIFIDAFYSLVRYMHGT